jgi:hypothetical protein
MAEHVDSAWVKRLEVVPYEEVRDKVRSGDVLFASGDYLISKTIQKCTGSPWSHVGIVFNVKSLDKRLLLESVEDMGVRFAPLSKYLSDYEDGKPYRGRLVLARCKGVNPEAVNRLAEFGIDELTQPYDTAEIAKILARIALGMGRKARDRQYICSELVYECFARAKIEFDYDHRGFVSPENIWLDPRITLVARIL